MSGRVGECFQTFSGNPFYPLDPHPDEILIEDIAHSLANTCRFGGHSREFFSVAQHSVNVSKLVPPALALQGLLHDAAEAFVADLVKPLKVMLPEYQNAEAVVYAAVVKKFNLPDEIDPEVKRADLIALATEARDLMTVEKPIWSKWIAGVEPSPKRIIPMCPKTAELMFLIRYHELTGLDALQTI